MGELSSSIAEAIRKRAVSAALGTYAFFWLSLHWQGVYATLFTSEEKIYAKYELLKNEYVNQYFFGWHGISTIIGYIIPAVLTAFFIWPLPKYILIHAYREEQKHKVAKRKVKLEVEQELEQKKENLAKQVEKTLDAEIKKVDKQKEAVKKDPTILWDEEYAELAKSSEKLAKFDEILTSVYAHNGNRVVYGDYNQTEFEISPQALKMGDVNGLIGITKDGKRIELTEKGRHFASKYDSF